SGSLGDRQQGTKPAPSSGPTTVWTKEQSGPFYVSYQRAGDKTPDSGELYGVYDTRAQAEKAVEGVRRWAATITPGYWSISNITVEGSATPSPTASTAQPKTTPVTSATIVVGDKKTIGFNDAAPKRSTDS